MVVTQITPRLGLAIVTDEAGVWEMQSFAPVAFFFICGQQLSNSKKVAGFKTKRTLSKKCVVRCASTVPAGMRLEKWTSCRREWGYVSCGRGKREL